MSNSPSSIATNDLRNSTVVSSLNEKLNGSTSDDNDVIDVILETYKKNLKLLVEKTGETDFLNQIEVHREYFAKVYCIANMALNGGEHKKLDKIKDKLDEYKGVKDISVFNEKTKELYDLYVEKGSKDVALY